jgi:hypothetical protein
MRAPHRASADHKPIEQPLRREIGKLDKLTIKLVPLKAAEEKLLHQKTQETKNKA